MFKSNTTMRPGAGRAKRRALGLTQADLARAVGVSVPTISLWETGQREITPERQELLASALGGRRGLFVTPTTAGKK